MKTAKQIELAQQLSEDLQDYIQLAKTEKKLKDESRVKELEELMQEIVDILSEEIQSL